MLLLLDIDRSHLTVAAADTAADMKSIWLLSNACYALLACLRAHSLPDRAFRDFSA